MVLGKRSGGEDMITLLVSLFILLALGVPVAFAIGLSAFSYFVIFNPSLIQILPQRMYAGVNSYAMIALPLFIFMGQVMNASTITKQLIDFALIFVGRLKGGLLYVDVVASMIFGGISGSSTSDVASIGQILIPEQQRRGYPAHFAAGITVASSTMGMIIPPSIAMVIYAITAQESVGRMFLGGAIPGILIGVSQLMIVFVIAKSHHYPSEDVDTSIRGVVTQVRKSILILIMPLFVVGSVTFGIATATESAAMGAVYALVLGAVILRKLSLKDFYSCLTNSAMTSGKIMMIIAFSQLYVWVLALERIPQMMVGVLLSLGLGPTGTMLLIVLAVLVVGTFLDVAPGILLLTPVFLPAAVQLGISPIQFGVTLVAALAVGACTPPVGNCLNVCAAVTGFRIGMIFRGALPWLIGNVIVLVLITLFPQLILWLPNMLMG
jgi:tripartite ATP-independent transporter DctM subunit